MQFGLKSVRLNPLVSPIKRSTIRDECTLSLCVRLLPYANLFVLKTLVSFYFNYVLKYFKLLLHKTIIDQKIKKVFFHEDNL